MDRWSIVTTLNYLPHDDEAEIVIAKAPYDLTTPGAPGTMMVRVRGHDPQRLHEQQPLDRDEPADGDHLGGKRRNFRHTALPSE